VFKKVTKAIFYCINKGKFVSVFWYVTRHGDESCAYTPRHEGVWGSGGITPKILIFGARWRWVVSFTSRPP